MFLGKDRPENESQHRYGYDSGHKIRGDTVGQFLYRCTTGGSLLYHGNNLGKQCIATHLIGLHDKGLSAIDRTGRNCRSYLLLYR